MDHLLGTSGEELHSAATMEQSQMGATPGLTEGWVLCASSGICRLGVETGGAAAGWLRPQASRGLEKGGCQGVNPVPEVTSSHPRSQLNGPARLGVGQPPALLPSAWSSGFLPLHLGPSLHYTSSGHSLGPLHFSPSGLRDGI